MAYVIRYANNTMVRQRKIIYKLPSKWMIALCAVILAVGILSIESVQNFLIPGDPAITRAAFSVFTQDIQNGEDLSDATVAFCRYIIERDTVE